MSDDDLPGWYGKIASLGDFASRRLPAEFISNWDAWLQRMLPDSRARLGDRWLETYLGSPIWRFLLFPGICGDGLWAGLMMPSVDRVGRYFPLTIASRMPALASTEREFDALADWLDRLSTAALATLDLRRGVQQFDATLTTLRAPLPAPPRVVLAGRIAALLHDLSPGRFALPSDDELGQTLMGVGAGLLTQHARGGSLWWTPCATGASAPLLLARGLPDGAQFAAMLNAGSTHHA
ncbi:MAG TPA: type VI secretion system-associated protein TagF [Thauera sp.]|jgi:type VI secretion system protein ImpM|uniref:type VI secretion system-associated protein TagF n=1 Tax=Thauera sp. TaxID=1905334 RepID=UPI000FC2398B|nr:type VI secretion system-associated protein TagF [Thauera sp.]MCB1945040.1 type VI secretion system-associated protein TagF [Thauera sp.]MCP5225202.1 type VI secretion system-associated protein TagF [Thauera sp.]RTL29856.1 MAG: type VI secretion system-associated protein TagF [Rhodocyclaceae bacterium]HRV78866.1 type VI secretion system-associated protein TagF [Thauera sp.]